jgi:hypothetical protein
MFYLKALKYKYDVGSGNPKPGMACQRCTLRLWVPIIPLASMSPLPGGGTPLQDV